MYSYGTPAGSNEANGWSVRTYQTFVGNVVSRDPDNLPFAKHLFERAVERGLTSEHLADYIDNLAAELDASQSLNFKRWKILDQNVHMNVGSNLLAPGLYIVKADNLARKALVR